MERGRPWWGQGRGWILAAADAVDTVPWQGGLGEEGVRRRVQGWQQVGDGLDDLDCVAGWGQERLQAQRDQSRKSRYRQIWATLWECGLCRCIKIDRSNIAGCGEGRWDRLIEGCRQWRRRPSRQLSELTRLPRRELGKLDLKNFKEFFLGRICI